MADVRAGPNIKIIKKKKKSLSEKIIAETSLNIDEEDELNDEQKESEGGNEMIFENESLKITFSHKKV